MRGKRSKHNNQIGKNGFACGFKFSEVIYTDHKLGNRGIEREFFNIISDFYSSGSTTKSMWDTLRLIGSRWRDFTMVGWVTPSTFRLTRALLPGRTAEGVARLATVHVDGQRRPCRGHTRRPGSALRPAGACWGRLPVGPAGVSGAGNLGREASLQAGAVAQGLGTAAAGDRQRSTDGRPVLGHLGHC